MPEKTGCFSRRRGERASPAPASVAGRIATPGLCHFVTAPCPGASGSSGFLLWYADCVAGAEAKLCVFRPS